jgi:hypothetical protein
MNSLVSLRLCALLGGCLSFAAVHAADASKEQYQAEKSRIEAEYKTARQSCDSLSGNPKDICVEEAKGKEKVAKAELDAQRSPSASNNEKVAKARADATYAVAKERCDDLAGNQKDVCVKEAKAARTKADVDAKASRKVGETRSEAASDKRDAQYKAEVEKCDTLAGDAKSSCVNSAKTKYGKS